VTTDKAASDLAEKWGQHDLRFGVEIDRMRGSGGPGDVNASSIPGP
jgi:hypothetical protein